MAEKPQDKKREIPQVVPTRFQLAEHGRNVWLVTAEARTQPSDFLQPEFWSHVAKDIRPGDMIQARTEDMSYWAEFLVLSCDRTWAQVHCLREAKLTGASMQPANADFIVDYKGLTKRWCVIRTSDHSIVHEGEQDKAAALTWLEGYARTVGRKAA